MNDARMKEWRDKDSVRITIGELEALKAETARLREALVRIISIYNDQGLDLYESGEQIREVAEQALDGEVR